MQNCEVCKSKFKWKELLFSIWSSYKPVECKNCGKKHTISFASKFFVSFLIIVPAVIFGLLIAPDMGLNKAVTFGIIVMIAFAISLLLPFFVKYEVKPKSE
ncbi:TIGR04104 family putative zinc finger protein [Bacillus sp. Marseille-Q1617]|uniref:TIGR04104 family putative zinc finger protein n=1 Tax=Bacillus sp. Marseille-Q1617 TaxID=2736887 RepID=UPI00158E183A|nr:TIGR04104 family putative zinc finger protein [Bacillus sp. Marseille-Q1617]